MTGDADRTSRSRRVAAGAGVVLVLGALALTVVAGMIRSATAPVDEIPVPGATAPAAAPDAEAPGLYVHVSGAVRAPGLYVLAAGARVVDALGAAGGFAADADRAAVNLARELSDGEQLHVPVEGEEVSSPPGGGQRADGRVNVNTADRAALDTLPGIGPALAGRIVEWREANGRFTSAEDLLAVPGIGESVLAQLRDRVVM